MAVTSSNIVDASFLESVEGEISFFRSIMRARPVGMHRHFHVLAVQSHILKDTGHLVRIEDIWSKLRLCYNLDQLEAIVRRTVATATPEGRLTGYQDLEAENFDSPNSKNGPVAIPSPSPSQNLSRHPFFREEFSLPYDEFEAIVAQRRLRSTASAPSSPTPAPRTKKGPTRKRGKSKLDLAGLVGGDSDSSALTQESGDEPVAETPRESVVTGTDAGTDYAEEEDVEMREPSPVASPKPTRGRGKWSKRGAGRGRGAAGASTRAAKKKKR
ncbi:hypothetical protein AX17_006201 [Amanita inopinata Kibby_2008]|nr:hypothetical protein AX17_006201 [Amanita inopinata Kibby_2008]